MAEAEKSLEKRGHASRFLGATPFVIFAFEWETIALKVRFRLKRSIYSDADGGKQSSEFFRRKNYNFATNNFYCLRNWRINFGLNYKEVGGRGGEMRVEERKG